MLNPYILYRFYYGEQVVYFGRTAQPIQNRIRGHVFGKPMHRLIDINSVSKIEITEMQSEADMFLYEIYYINKLKPPLNCDDRARDDLTVSLPELNFTKYEPKLWEKWKNQINERCVRYMAERHKMLDAQLKKTELRRRCLAGDITREQYYEKLDEINNEEAQNEHN